MVELSLLAWRYGVAFEVGSKLKCMSPKTRSIISIEFGASAHDESIFRIITVLCFSTAMRS